jgi:enolase-phosphatase E1
MGKESFQDSVDAILLDIEGTTTPVDFVYQLLFPYARARVREFLQLHFKTQESQALINLLAQEHAEDERRGLNPPALQTAGHEAEADSLTSYVRWLMDQDRKTTALKELQGRIWVEGYRTGSLLSRVFDDVPPALERWRRLQKSVCIYSSGSVLAQKLLFSYTSAGNLTEFIDAYFDTHIGRKTEPQSYENIAGSLGRPVNRILFVSDALAELDAAHSKGMQTALCVRPGNPAQPGTHPHAVITSFDQL